MHLPYPIPSLRPLPEASCPITAPDKETARAVSLGGTWYQSLVSLDSQVIRPVFYVCGLFVVNLGNLHYKGMVLI